MTAMRIRIDEAHARGITLRVDGSELVIGGDYTDKFIGWAKRHKAELVAELRPLRVLPSLYPFHGIDALLDRARAGTHYTIPQAKELLADDLDDFEAGRLTVEQARHYLQHCAAERIQPGANPYQLQRIDYD